MSRALLCLCLLAAACEADPDVVTGDAVAHGEALFAGRAPASPSKLNVYACADCHRAAPQPGDTALLPGATLAGATLRPGYWGGAETELLRAINHCRRYFMHAQQDWQAEDVEARAMYAWLESLPPALPQAVTATFVGPIADLPPGDATQGQTVFARACQPCHGAVTTGKGRLAPGIPRLPEQTLAEHPGYTPTQQRLVFVEKVRHGPFYGYGGVMPPFSREVLGDDELSALLSYLGLHGQ